MIYPHLCKIKNSNQCYMYICIFALINKCVEKAVGGYIT